MVSVYKFGLSDASWNAEHCKVIAFIVNKENDEVLQAVTASVTGVYKNED